MRRTCLSLAAVSAATLLFAGCSGAPTVDLDAARTWMQTVSAAGPTVGGDVGFAGMQVGESSSEVRLDFDEPIPVARIRASCFGDGDLTATVTVSLLGTDGVDLVARSQEITCDREPHDIAVDGTAVDGVAIAGTADADTYLLAEAIREVAGSQ